MNINAAKIFARMKTAWVDRGNQGIAGEILANEVDRLEAKLTEAQNARADTLAENVKLNDALGQIHILCADAGIDPGNVVDRVRGLADKAQSLDRLEEMGGAIWEICSGCGAKWADDEGGRPEWQEPKEITDARNALDLAEQKIKEG